MSRREGTARRLEMDGLAMIPQNRNPDRWVGLAAAALAATLAWGALAALAPLAALPARRVAEAARFPYQLDAEEGFILNQALRLADGRGLYGPISQPPYLVDNYPPLYPALWALVARWTGPSLAPGRILSAAASLATALLVAWLILAKARATGREGRHGGVFWAVVCPLAIAMPIVFLTSRAWMRWNPYARVDVLAVALSLGGLAAFPWGAGRQDDRRRRWVSAACFALAFLTKQTALAAPAACVLYLLAARPRQALRFAATLAAGFIVPLAWLVAWTRGGYWAHLVTYNRNAMHWNELVGWARMLWGLYAPLLLAALAALAAGALAPGRGRAGLPVLLVALYLGLNALFLLTLAKAGAAENYVLEFMVALALAVGLGVVAALRPPSGGWPRALALVALGLLAFHGARFGVGGRIAQALYLSAPRPTVGALVAGDAVVRRIGALEGDVLSEDPIYALRAGRDVGFQHFIMTQLAAEGRWDDAPFVARLRSRGFALIVAHRDVANERQFFNRHTPDMRRAIAEHYRLARRLDRPAPLQPIFLFEPRKEADR